MPRLKEVNGWLTIGDVAEMAGINPYEMYYRLNNGLHARPTHGHLQRKYYTQEEATKIVASIRNTTEKE
jgi:hypothetical protein